MLTTQDKHNLGCQKVARLRVSLAQGMIGRERLMYLDYPVKNWEFDQHLCVNKLSGVTKNIISALKFILH